MTRRVKMKTKVFPVNEWIAFPCICPCRCKSLNLFRLSCPVLIHAVNISSCKTLTTLVSLSATNVSICIGWGQLTLPQLPRHHFVNASWTQVVLKIRRKEYWQEYHNASVMESGDGMSKLLVKTSSHWFGPVVCNGD